MGKAFDDLQNGVVLAELGGHGNGPYCARYGKGASLVIMGTYIIDTADDVPYPKDFVFKPDKGSYSDYLHEHIQSARKSGAKVGVSAISVEVKHTVDFLISAEEAGADYVSLCAYSVMEMFTSKGLGCRLYHRDNRDKFKTWVGSILNAVGVPFIFKLGVSDEPFVAETVDILSELGVSIVHAAADNAADSYGVSIIKSLAPRCRFLIAGGGIDSVDSAKRVLSTGAGAVSIAKAAMKDPDFLGRLQKNLVHPANE